MTTRVETAEHALRPERPQQAGPVIQRHPVDLVRVLLGLAVFGIGFLIAQRGELPVFERDLFRIVNDLPAIVFPIVWVVMQLGNVLAVPVVAGVAARTGRVPQAPDQRVAGGVAEHAPPKG